MLSVVVPQFPSDDSAIRYVLPVLWMFAPTGRLVTSPPRALSSAQFSDFWATVCKTLRPMLTDRCPVCPVCDVGVPCIVAIQLDESR